MKFLDGSFLNVAEICQATHALGPGLRAAIWVQGCPIHCKGCIAPDWLPFEAAHLLKPVEAAEKLLQRPDIEGISISGGEPMLQAAGLTAMLEHIRNKKDVHVICFTGFQYEALLKWDPGRKIQEFLSEIDVLIDGPYVERRNTGQTFAGSTNQRIINLSKRDLPGQQTWLPRKMELHIRDRNILAVGIPPNQWVRDPVNYLPLGRKKLVEEK